MKSSHSTSALRVASKDVSIVEHVTPQLSVVIPAYNEAARIEKALQCTHDFLSGRGETWEIVVVDDGSTDHTALAIQRSASGLPAGQVRLVQLPRNQGKGAALRAGVAASCGERVLVMDADLATPVEELSVLERAIDAGAAVAAGSRAVAGSAITRSQAAVRVMLGRLGNLWIRSLAVPRIHDTQCGFKLFRGEVARDLFARCREDRFGIDIEVLGLASRLHLPIAEVGIRWRHQEGSKVRWKDYLEVFLKVPRIAWSQRRVGSVQGAHD